MAPAPAAGRQRCVRASSSVTPTEIGGRREVRLLSARCVNPIRDDESTSCLEHERAVCIRAPPCRLSKVEGGKIAFIFSSSACIRTAYSHMAACPVARGVAVRDARVCEAQ